MPTFQISDPPPTATLTEATESGRQVARATVSFVVENKTPVKRAAVASVIPEAQDDPGIYLIEGASSTMTTVRSLDFEANGSQTVNVTVAVPRGEAVKKGAFHLRVARDTESDDDAVDSRPVAFEAAALAAAPKPARPFPWWAVIAAAVVVLIGAAGLWWVLTPKYPGAEEIQFAIGGKTIAEATTYLEEKKMTGVYRVIRRDDQTAGTVLAVTKDPAKASEAVVTYDPGIVTLIGMPVPDAETLVRDTWKLGVASIEDRSVASQPNLVGVVTVSSELPQNITLAFDPGVAVPNLVGSSPSSLEGAFAGLSGLATLVINPTSEGDDPAACYDVISSQTPLNATGVYKTDTNFFFRWKHGTNVSRICTIIVLPPDFDFHILEERMPDIFIDPSG